MKERILKAHTNIPSKNLANYIEQGIISFTELRNAGLSETKETEIKEILNSRELELWHECQESNKLEDYNYYLNLYPNGLHLEKALSAINRIDNALWEKASSSLSEEDLHEYSNSFPEGNHIDECNDYLNDLPWLQTCLRNTIPDYETYIQQFPGKHDREAQDAINSLNDKKDWNDACSMGNSNAYRTYLDNHPNGNHSNEAYQRIQANAGRDELINNLQNDPNFYTSEQIQEQINNNVASWDDIKDVFGEEKTNAIANFQTYSFLPHDKKAPDRLIEDSTEVYFWGTPYSGKTCALGAILSSLQKKGIFTPLDCASRNYMDHLTNIFVNDGIIILPSNTPEGSIQEMRMDITDKKKKSHYITFVDLAGELFRHVYYIRHGLPVDDEADESINTVSNYLKDRRNKKIHFFVVEYGAHSKEWDGLRMVNYLDNMIGYLQSEKILTKSTVGVYILVTKCDKINCDKDERPKEAYNYIRNYLPSFYNTLERTCEKSGIKDLKVMSFSIGDVFAQKLCKFESNDTDKIIEKLILNTHPRGGFTDFFRK